MTKLRLFIADDHPILRAGLKAVLDTQPDMHVVGECSDGGSVVEKVAECKPDVVLLDVVLPRLNGARATEELLTKNRDVKVLALSAFDDARHVEEMLAAGASGYVVKRTASDELVEAIRRVARGERFIDPAVAYTLDLKPDPQLSRREFAVLKGVARGLALKEIAASLDVSVRSVETYRERAMSKTSLKTRADVIKYAASRGWLLDE